MLGRLVVPLLGTTVFFVSLKEPQKADILPEHTVFVAIVTGGKQEGAIPCACTQVQTGGIGQEAQVLSQVKAEARRRDVPVGLYELSSKAQNPAQARLLDKWSTRLGYDFGRYKFTSHDGNVRGGGRVAFDAAGGTLTVDLRQVAPDLAKRYSLESLRLRIVSEAGIAPKTDASLPVRTPSPEIVVHEPARGTVRLLCLRERDGRLVVITLDRTVTSNDPVDPESQKLVDEYFAAERDAAISQVALAKAPKTSSDSCKSCHATEYDAWRKSRHASALKTLVDAGKNVPECLSCHQYTGSRRVFSENSVECQSCHGGTDGHALSPTAFKVSAVSAKEVCTSCHTAKTDPKFDYLKRYHSIKH